MSRINVFGVFEGGPDLRKPPHCAVRLIMLGLMGFDSIFGLELRQASLLLAATAMAIAIADAYPFGDLSVFEGHDRAYQ